MWLPVVEEGGGNCGDRRGIVRERRDYWLPEVLLDMRQSEY